LDRASTEVFNFHRRKKKGGIHREEGKEKQSRAARLAERTEKLGKGRKKNEKTQTREIKAAVGERKNGAYHVQFRR